jgi:hypothetical protein
MLGNPNGELVYHGFLSDNIHIGKIQEDILKRDRGHAKCEKAKKGSQGNDGNC